MRDTSKVNSKHSKISIDKFHSTNLHHTMDNWIQNLKTMQANANNNVVNSNVLEQHTNKLFLIENQKDGLRYLGKNLTSDLMMVQQTLTQDIKFANAVSLDLKNRIQIKDLLKSLNKPIDGKFLLCRTICPPCKMTALMTIVDDPDGKLGTKILLYNFVPSAAHISNENAYHYLPVGSILAIMNPWFKATAEGGVAVRCDNPSHVVRLNSSKYDHILEGLTWKGRIPSEFQINEPDVAKTTASDWKMIGNCHFTSKRFQESVTAYTNGLDSENKNSKLWLDLLSNRSAAHLKLTNYKFALTDTQSVLDVDKTHLKCIFRQANALFGMARYEEAESFLRSLSLDISEKNQKVIDELISKGERLTAQSRTGDYKWKEILANVLPDYSHDIAEYRGAVAVKNSPNKGRGLFATETIKAGQLILASRAFAYVVRKSRDGIFLNSKNNKYFNTRTQTELVTIIAQKLTNCPEKCAEFYSLYGGIEYSNEKSSQVDAQVDIKRIGEICHYNSFGQGGFGGTTEDDVSGIWIFPSFVNHSCVDANSSWMRNGDFIFVRAFRDIPEGQEIFICYLTPFESMIQKKLQKFEFTCDCRLCNRDRVDTPKIQAFRSDLQAKLDKIFVKTGTDPTHLDDRKNAEVLTIINLLNESRADAPELNIFFLDKIEMMALSYIESGLNLKCVAILENVYKLSESIAALCHFTLNIIGNIIEVYLIVDDKKSATPWYEILKRKALLCFGTLDAIEIRLPATVKMLQVSGLYQRKSLH